MWAAIMNVVMGLWMMITPALFDFEKRTADNHYIVGPLVITFAITAIWEVNRSTRYFNLVAGLWLAASPFLLSFQQQEVIWINLITGIIIALLSLVRGKIKGQYGGGWRSLFEKNSAVFEK